jgi:tRNA pseudouridine65 synthase
MANKVNILYQDDHYIVAEKPAGILVHPYKERSKDRRHLMRSVKKQTGLYLYPIHRLDKPVSGIVIFGLSPEATRNIKEIWNTEDVSKKYLALCKGEIEEEGVFNFSLKNDKGIQQEAQTHYRRVDTNGELSLVDIAIKTGRKHQIRRHFSRRMHNLVGDSKYGQGELNREFKFKYKFYRLFLHAYQLNFKHPLTGEQIEINCKIPEELDIILKDLKLNWSQQ